MSVINLIAAFITKIGFGRLTPQTQTKPTANIFFLFSLSPFFHYKQTLFIQKKGLFFLHHIPEPSTILVNLPTSSFLPYNLTGFSPVLHPFLLWAESTNDQPGRMCNSSMIGCSNGWPRFRVNLLFPWTYFLSTIISRYTYIDTISTHSANSYSPYTRQVSTCPNTNVHANCSTNASTNNAIDNTNANSVLASTQLWDMLQSVHLACVLW